MKPVPCLNGLLAIEVHAAETPRELGCMAQEEKKIE